MKLVPYVCLYDQLDKAFSTLQVENFKSVQHEDDELNSDYSIDPLADPRLDRMDLFNMVDSDQRDELMNASASYNVSSDVVESPSEASEAAPKSAAGSGE